MRKRARKLPGGWLVDRNNLLRRDTEVKNRRSTAIHEAAHAVIAHFLDERVLEVKIDPISSGLGRTTVSYRARFGKIDPIARVAVALAGHEAECLAYKRPINQLPYEDYRVVLRLGLSKIGIALVAQETRRWVRKLMPEIHKVQKALLIHNRLSRRQFLKALKT